MARSNDRQDINAVERLLSLREKLKNVCQLGVHGTEEFTRSQKKAVLSITMALLAEPTAGFLNKSEHSRATHFHPIFPLAPLWYPLFSELRNVLVDPVATGETRWQNILSL